MTKLEELIRKAKAEGKPHWYYEKTEEPLADRSVWENLPAYYTKHVAEKNEKVNRIAREMGEYDAFVFFSDAHLRQNAMTSVPIIKNILRNTPVRDVIYGGDTISAWVDREQCIEDIDYFRDAYAFCTPYLVKGNHDVAGCSYNYADEGYVMPHGEIVERLYQTEPRDAVRRAGKSYYYFDRPDAKLRYIVLDTSEFGETGKTAIGGWKCELTNAPEQAEWFLDLLKRTEKGWRIVVAGHIPFHKDLKWNKPGICWISDAVEAFNQKTSFSSHAAVLMDRENLDETPKFRVGTDFSGTEGRIILTLCGHGHIDDAAVGKSGCVNYEIFCDAWDTNNGGSKFTREKGTVTESAVDVFLIDRGSGRIESVRYGAGEDRILKE